MKKLFKKWGKLKPQKFEAIIFNVDEKPEQIFERLTKTFNIITKKVCDHQSPNGKTICLVLQEGLVEIHELIDKGYTYISFTCPNKRLFENYKKKIVCKN